MAETKNIITVKNKTKHDIIPLVFITDENYIMPTFVAILSLKMNKKTDTHYDVNIIVENVEQYHIKNLEKLESDDFRITIIKYKNKYKSLKIKNLHVSTAAIAKFEIANILKKYDKAIYLDGDVIIQKDLKELFDTNIQEQYASVVKDMPTTTIYNPTQPQRLGISHKYYFNSGVMLLNLKKLRDDKISKKLIHYRENGLNFFMDQDALNVCFGENVKYIDLSFNCMTTLFQKFSNKDINKFYSIDSDSDPITTAKIIHFSSKYKPWKYYHTLHESIWFDYFYQSPYAHNSLNRIYKNDLCLKVVISLTSYPARIQFVPDTIKTLLNQSLKADKIILNLGSDKFPNKEKDLPEELVKLIGNEFQINWMEKDLRSFSKLIPTLKNHPDSIIVTADDDILYPVGWLEKLIASYKKEPHLIHCHRAHRIVMENMQFLPYNKWLFEHKDSSISYWNFLTGVGGVLYPPNCLHKDVFKIEKFQELCPLADDIWFWAMALLNNTKIKIIENPYTKLSYVEGSQEIDSCLWKTNVSHNKNDIQLQNVLKEYPEIMKKLLEEENPYLKKLDPTKAYLLFPVYLIKTAKMKKKIHKKVCRIIRGQLNHQFENTLLLTKHQIRDFALKNSPAPDYVKKNIKKITNDIYDKFHFRKKHRILGIKFYTKNKHKELSSLLTYSIKQNDLLKQENSVLKNQITELSTSNKHLYRLFNNLIEKYTLSKQGLNTFEYRTFGDLAQTIRKNLYKFPNDIDLIVGVPRSGIIPAYMIALFMNKKCCSLDEFLSETTISNGFRNISEKKIKNVLIVDDSLCSGQEMSRVKEKVSHLTSKYEILFSTIYIKPDASEKVDIWLEKVNTQRIWQWNYLNHGISKKACFDIDGVLCVDPTPEQNDDGENYREFLKTAKPLYIPTYEIHSLVTSRLEKYRSETEEWLKKHNVKYKNLIMLDLPSADERRRLNCHAKFKAEQYQKLQDTVLFVESEETQAKEIALLTGKQVICTANDEMY